MAAVAPSTASSVSEWRPEKPTPAKGAPKKSWWGKIIPDTFYAIKEDVKPIASAGITRTLTVVLYLLAIGVFAGLWVFYSDKSQWVSKSLTLSEYSRAGFKCVPLQGMDLHGLTGTMMTYDDCLDTVEPVSATNVVKQDNDYVYKWTTGGLASYGASSTTETVSNPTWEKEGYVCRPASKDSHYGLVMSYDECLDAVRPLSDSSFKDTQYKPFADSDIGVDYTFVKRTKLTNAVQNGEGSGPHGKFLIFTLWDRNTGTCMHDESKSREACCSVCGNTWNSEGACAFHVYFLGQVTPYPYPHEEHNVSKLEGFSCLSEVVPGLAPSATELCKHFGIDAPGPFECIKTTSNDALPTTHDQAVTYYKKNYAPDALCAPLKENAPFQCTGSEPKSAAEILSLTYANTQLAFSAFGSIFVWILYKYKKTKDPDFLQEDELAKLKADNAAMKADNAAIKKAMEEENAAMKSAMEATNEAIKRLEAGKA